MDPNALTQRTQEAIQEAQAKALRLGHTETDVEHLLLALLDQRDGLVPRLLTRAEVGRPALRGGARELPRGPAARVRPGRGAGAGVRLAPPQRAARPRAGGGRPPSRRVRLGRARAAGDARRGIGPARQAGSFASTASPASASSRCSPQVRGAPAGDQRDPRGHLRGAGEVRPRPRGRRPLGPPRPGDRPRRGDPPGDPDPLAQDQEQPGADRRTGRRQDGDRGGPGPAHRARRRPRGPQATAHRRARHGLAAGRRQVSRRVRGAPQGGAQGGPGAPRGGSCCSSTSCTPWWARARPRARWTPATCSSRCWPAASCTASARPRWTSTASTSRRTRRSSVASSPSWWTSRRWRTRSRSCAGCGSATRSTTACGSRTPRWWRPPSCRIATSPTASCPTRRSTSWTRRAPCPDRDRLDAAGARRDHAADHAARDRGGGARARRPTPPAASGSRRSRRSWPTCAREHDAMRAQWETEKAAIEQAAELREQLEQLRLEIERGRARLRPRTGWPSCGTAKLPELERAAAAARRSRLARRRTGSGCCRRR